MKTIKTSGVFKKDLKKAGLSAALVDVLYHQPDLVLIYKANDEILELHRLDSHSEIFG